MQTEALIFLENVLMFKVVVSLGEATAIRSGNGSFDRECRQRGSVKYFRCCSHIINVNKKKKQNKTKQSKKKRKRKKKGERKKEKREKSFGT